MRQLNFTGIDRVLFYENLYDGLVNSPRGLDYKETRIIGRVLDKIEFFGHTVSREGRDTYTINDPVKTLSLEDAEYSLVMDLLRAIKWVGKYAREASKFYDWLDSAIDPSLIQHENAAKPALED